jgi:hypothetical protein
MSRKPTTIVLECDRLLRMFRNRQILEIQQKSSKNILFYKCSKKLSELHISQN